MDQYNSSWTRHLQRAQIKYAYFNTSPNQIWKNILKIIRYRVISYVIPLIGFFLVLNIFLKLLV